MHTLARIGLSSFSLLIGGLIYLAFRSKSLVMFGWADFLGIEDEIETLRRSVNGVELYDWIMYSLPDGLWLFSYLIASDIIWKGQKNIWSKLSLCSLPTIAITSEFAQLIGLLPGVFDLYDIACYIGAVGLWYLMRIK